MSGVWTQTYLISKPSVGSQQYQQIWHNVKHSPAGVQQQIYGPIHCRGGCSRSARLERAQQLCQPAIQANSKCASGHTNTRGACNINCPMVASLTLVPDTAESVNCAPSALTKKGTHTGRCNHARGVEEQKVAHIRLECVWREQTRPINGFTSMQISKGNAYTDCIRKKLYNLVWTITK